MSRLLEQGLLILYNSIEMLGWGSVFACMMLEVVLGPQWRAPALQIARFVQPLMFLDVMFSVLGFVKNNWFLAAIQVIGRCHALFIVFEFVPHSLGLYPALICWSAAQTIRYSFYLLSLLKLQMKLITWLRYNAFILLYPTGVSGQLITMYHSFAHFMECCPRPFSITMPNKYNFSFDIFYFHVFFMVLFLPGFAQLFNSLLLTRARRNSKLKTS